VVSRRAGHAFARLVLAALLGSSVGSSARAQAGLAASVEGGAAALPLSSRVGVASWYGPGFHGRLTACGEIFDQDALTAAHRSLPFGTLLAVTNLDTGCRVTLRVNDRGPYHGHRILDCSRAGAEELGFIDAGIARIQWEIVSAAAVAGNAAESLRSGSASPGFAAGEGAGAAVEPPRPMNTEEVPW
jgi:rare lipoprotein A (peptidoglycan hydrolase)